ncbi:uncharacterized protein LOC114579246 [Dendrobium catenatum]|uniref:uncharacterized protein LOC114579246 n=1 Tax=Dendrobium catenatum TaxID=906689 RepID=UPI0010A0BC9D|nr:uncharacterized protein LOC114579246 [Dendrobium catenatum]
MNVLRPSGSLRPNGRGLNGIMIREGEVPRCRQVPVDGKGKNLLVESMVGKKSLGVKRNPSLAILEPSASNALILRVNKFSEVLDTLKGRNIEDDLTSVEALKEVKNLEDRSLDSVDPEIQKNKINEVAEAWSKPKPIKISFNRDHVEFSKDGIAVKLNADMEIRLPCLPLYFWDEDNIARIASCLGTPMYIDSNTFYWGKREFARCGRVGHNRDICLENVAIGIQNQGLKEMEVVNDNSEKVVPDSKTYVISSEYGPWIHVDFKNKRGNRGNVIGKGIYANRVSTAIRGNINKKVNLQKEIKMMNEEGTVAGHNVLVPNISSETENLVGKKNSDNVLTNRFAVLSDSIEEECMGNHAETDKIDVRDRESMDANISIYGLGSHSGAAKVRLSKELRSLGPVELDYKKKKSLGTWKVATIYGSRCCKERGSLWNQLHDFMEDSIPSIIGGDFNCINNKEEKRGGKRFLFSKGPREMKSFMVNSYFHDIGSIGPRFTWCNNKEGTSRIWERLDRCILNSYVHELNITLRRLSTWWNQRAKVRWHEEGDTNSRFFRNFSSARRNGIHINQVKDELNMIQVKEDQIEKVFTKFFEKKWNYRKCELTGWPLVDESQKVNDEDMLMLNEEFSVNELQLSIFQHGNNKAPGIDGVTSSFYKSYWSIVWDTLWSDVNRFFKTSILNKEWKDTLITLISKVKYPLIPSNYRPISLCQTNYKIMASMLVNRLKKVIGKMVSKEQAAFIPGRSISEHCLLA